MKKQSENDFKSKFSLLNSQQNFDEIVWSCSDSSDYENNIVDENLGNANKTINRKRKRVKTRKKTSKNVSNLDITFVDASSEHKEDKNSSNRSPIFQNVKVKQSSDFAYTNHKNEIPPSPILSSNSRNCNRKEIKPLSPILLPNQALPKISLNVRKKLFSHSNCKEIVRSTSPVLKCSPVNKQLRDNSCISGQNVCNFNKSSNQGMSNTNHEHCSNKEAKLNECILLEDDIQIEDVCEENNLNDTLTTKTTNVALIEKVKSYFDSHFSSETQSQQSISEYDTTPKNSSKTSEEIEFVNSQTEKNPLPQGIKLEKKSSLDSLGSLEHEYEVEKSKKKVRYKKGGLAHRLSELLKKQKANISLWQHERFLAANSNFVIPNEDFTAFRVQNVTFKYGCHLVELIDFGCQKYLALVNNLNENNNFKEQVTIFKLYKPYKIIDFNEDYQIIVNISKFECT